MQGAHHGCKTPSCLLGHILLMCWFCRQDVWLWHAHDCHYSLYPNVQACGASSDVDMRHRLNTYIIKNPPEDKISKAEKR